MTYEPPHDKTNKMACAPSQDSDQPLCAQWVAKDSSFLHADNEDSDQTGRMPRLIWVFAERKVILLVLSWGGSYIRFQQFKMMCIVYMHIELNFGAKCYNGLHISYYDSKNANRWQDKHVITCNVCTFWAIFAWVLFAVNKYTRSKLLSHKFRIEWLGSLMTSAWVLIGFREQIQLVKNLPTFPVAEFAMRFKLLFSVA